MPNIRPSSELRNNYNEISAFCHKFGEPVYITKNGTGDLVVMSIETYERLVGKFKRYTLLEKGLEDVKAGRVEPAEQFSAELMEDLERNGRLHLQLILSFPRQVLAGLFDLLPPRVLPPGQVVQGDAEIIG